MTLPRWLGRALLVACLALTTAAPATAEHVARAPQSPWDLIAGQELNSTSGARCTLGFSAHTSAGGRYVLSAGHCVTAGSTWYGRGGYIGTTAGSSFPSNDYGVIRVQSPDAMSTPLVDRWDSGSDVTVTGTARPTVGSSLCYSSPFGGWRCGTVTAVNQTVCYPNGCVYQLIRINVCAEPGTSGAPVVTNPGSGTTVKAVGLIVGSSGNCSSGGTTWAQPVQEPLNRYGLTLYTG